MNTFKAGDRVRVKPQNTHAGIMGDWICDKMLTKNWELKRPDDYTGPNAHKRLRAKPEQLDFASSASNTASAAQVNDFKIVNEGAIVHVNIPGSKIPAGLYVVTKGNISGNPARLNIAEIGGGKYWRVPVSAVRVIPRDQFTIHVK